MQLVLSAQAQRIIDLIISIFSISYKGNPDPFLFLCILHNLFRYPLPYGTLIYKFFPYDRKKSTRPGIA